MFRRSFLLFVFAMLIGLLTGCATMGSRYGMSLDPGVFEDCFEMKAGQVLEYSFETEKPVDFNVHYHEDGNMFFPVTEENVSSRQGTVTAEITQYYCIMFTNHFDDAVGFTYKYSVKDQ